MLVQYPLNVVRGRSTSFADVNVVSVAVPINLWVEPECGEVWVGEKSDDLNKGYRILVDVEFRGLNSPAPVEKEQLECVDGHRKGINKTAARLLFKTLSVGR